jgi:hypothetical protein
MRMEAGESWGTLFDHKTFVLCVLGLPKHCIYLVFSSLTVRTPVMSHQKAMSKVAKWGAALSWQINDRSYAVPSECDQ